MGHGPASGVWPARNGEDSITLVIASSTSAYTLRPSPRSATIAERDYNLRKTEGQEPRSHALSKKMFVRCHSLPIGPRRFNTESYAPR